MNSFLKNTITNILIIFCIAFKIKICHFKLKFETAFEIFFTKRRKAARGMTNSMMFCCHAISLITCVINRSVLLKMQINFLFPDAWTNFWRFINRFARSRCAQRCCRRAAAAAAVASFCRWAAFIAVSLIRTSRNILCSSTDRGETPGKSEITNRINKKKKRRKSSENQWELSVSYLVIMKKLK